MTETLTEDLVIGETDAETTEKPAEEVDLNRLRKPAPPKKGLCRRCGEDKPINRLMLCYPCWVKSELEKDGWREGQPHPDHCGCTGVGGHETRKSEGN
jgi:hypothetical protein